jgi:tetratricopeptide (TPR) repeat protein
VSSIRGQADNEPQRQESAIVQKTVEHDPSAAAGAAMLELPTAPASEDCAVKAWSQPVTMLTYAPGKPDRNPLFLEKRVYQGSNGKVYPLPVIDHIATEPCERSWDAIHLENEFLRLMILPQIGGRIHVGLDKRTGYDFFYRQNVIKPALVGLAGPWISGGVEFNWPQHHRPATFMPVETSIERDSDGSVTVWCSDHDPMSRMKGMHGVCLRPGQAVVEVKVRLYNRTLDTQTFLWWANVATQVHERYQSFFPKDVRFAADHAKRAITEYPLSQGDYYGIDYGQRGRTGVPAELQPPKFVPDGSYAANDLGWYANIPVPTSYMIVGSRGDFFGGYDHGRRAGTVAVSNHHIAPGKKQWTWGNHEFGYAWDRSLTDSDGPYVELMSGVYTDNQPDFSFLAPGETKTFSQFWYPIAEIGVPDLASVDAALRVETDDREVVVNVQVTRPLAQSTLIVTSGSTEVGRWNGDLSPEHPNTLRFPTASETEPLTVVIERCGRTLLRYAAAEILPVEKPALATEPALPAAVASNDELFLNGLHLEQYRHPTRAPEQYWREALRRDAGDSRCSHALGRWHLRRGEFAKAESLIRVSIARLTVRNPNPYDGEPHYNLGLSLLYQERIVEAYEAFYKSTWNAAWRAAGHLRLAEIDCQRQDWLSALAHLDRSLKAEADNLNARSFKVLVLERLDRLDEAKALLRETFALDRLDTFTRFLLHGDIPQEGQLRLDLGFDLLRGGFLEEALRVVAVDVPDVNDGTVALLGYAEAAALYALGREQESALAYRRAAVASADYVFPSRLDEIPLLEKAIASNPHDARASYFLGNLLYDRRRHREAIAMWERSTKIDPHFSTVWRNLGFAYQNVLHDGEKAAVAFRHARELAPEDPRLLYEQDQLLKRMATPLGDRLKELETHRSLVDRRDDLSLELASLYNSLGRSDLALQLLLGRKSQPWEGGEGKVLEEFVRANVLLAQAALRAGTAARAVDYLDAASMPPMSLSEAKHLLMNLSIIDYWLGVAHATLGDHQRASESWRRATEQRVDFQQMQVKKVSETTYWSAMALRKLQLHDEAASLFQKMIEYARELEREEPKIDYFATSLPAMLLFEEDLKARQATMAKFLEAQGRLGLGDSEGALSLLENVLERDCSHSGSIDLLKLIQGDACTVL